MLIKFHLEKSKALTLLTFLSVPLSCSPLLVSGDSISAMTAMSGKEVSRPLSTRKLAKGKASHKPITFLANNQLCELALPKSTASLGWMAEARLENLRMLSAAGTTITSLAGMPGSVTHLDLSYNKYLQSLQGLPGDLRSLDIRQTSIQSLSRLPSNLQSLKLSGTLIKDMGAFPSQLQDLYLEEVNSKNLSELPRGLSSLHISGRLFEDLKGLPPNLATLTLQATSVRSLESLPSKLTRLELDSNTMREDGSLPELLEMFAVNEQLVPIDFRKMRYLVWHSDRRRNSSMKLPDSLVTLTLMAARAEPPKLPFSLLTLKIIEAPFDPVGSLPSDLESLFLTMYRGPELLQLAKLPRLKKLVLDSPSFKKIPKLPARLEELHLRQTDIKDLKGLPRNLKRFVLCETTLKELPDLDAILPELEELTLCNSGALVKIEGLPKKKLLKLDISNTGISSLPKLGAKVRELNISGTKIRLASMRNFPVDLRVLTLSEGQISDLTVPRKLEVLRFDSASAVEKEDKEKGESICYIN